MTDRVVLSVAVEVRAEEYLSMTDRVVLSVAVEGRAEEYLSMTDCDFTPGEDQSAAAESYGAVHSRAHNVTADYAALPPLTTA